MNPLDLLLWALAISFVWLVGSVALGVTWSVIRSIQKRDQR